MEKRIHYISLVLLYKKHQGFKEQALILVTFNQYSH